MVTCYWHGNIPGIGMATYMCGDLVLSFYYMYINVGQPGCIIAPVLCRSDITVVLIAHELSMH